jgi:hypothetical protein
VNVSGGTEDKYGTLHNSDTPNTQIPVETEYYLSRRDCTGFDVGATGSSNET